MFNLEQSISAWRKQMISSGVQSPVPLDELEAHLRDDIARQTQRGADAQTAFDAAIQRMGNAPTLKNEFAKVHGSLGERKIIVIFMPLMVLSFSLMLVASVLLKAGIFAEMNFRQQMLCFAAAAALSLFCWSGLLAQGFLPAIHNKRTRDAVYCFAGALLALWWITFFYLVLPGGDFGMAQLLVAIIWAYLVPYGMFAGLMAGLEKAALRRAEN